MTCYIVFQVYEFLLFAALMAVDILIFISMSMKYKYVDGSAAAIRSRSNSEEDIASGIGTSSVHEMNRSTSLSNLSFG